MKILITMLLVGAIFAATAAKADIDLHSNEAADTQVFGKETGMVDNGIATERGAYNLDKSGDAWKDAEDGISESIGTMTVDMGERLSHAAATTSIDFTQTEGCAAVPDIFAPGVEECKNWATMSMADEKIGNCKAGKDCSNDMKDWENGSTLDLPGIVRRQKAFEGFIGDGEFWKYFDWWKIADGEEVGTPGSRGTPAALPSSAAEALERMKSKTERWVFAPAAAQCASAAVHKAKRKLLLQCFSDEVANGWKKVNEEYASMKERSGKQQWKCRKMSYGQCVAYSMVLPGQQTGDQYCDIANAILPDMKIDLSGGKNHVDGQVTYDNQSENHLQGYKSNRWWRSGGLKLAKTIRRTVAQVDDWDNATKVHACANATRRILNSDSLMGLIGSCKETEATRKKMTYNFLTDAKADKAGKFNDGTSYAAEDYYVEANFSDAEIDILTRNAMSFHLWEKQVHMHHVDDVTLTAEQKATWVPWVEACGLRQAIGNEAKLDQGSDDDFKDLFADDDSYQD